MSPTTAAAVNRPRGPIAGDPPGGPLRFGRRPPGHAVTVARRMLRSRRAALGVILLSTLAFVAIFAELLAGPAPLVAVGPSSVSLLPAVVHPERYENLTEAEVRARHAADWTVWPLFSSSGPSATVDPAAGGRHLLGTDARGRDLCARLVYGTRTAIGLSLAAVLAGMLLGVALGGLAGYQRGFFDDRLVRLVETVDTFPAIIVVALVRAIEREPSPLSLVVAVALVRWAEVARLVRAEVLRASAEGYVMAARALGCSPLRVLWRHVLPNVLGPVVVSSVFGVASVVLLECAVSFLEMGAPMKAASWGETLAQGARDPSRPALLLLPGALLLTTIGSSYLVADALRDALDPRTVRTGRE